MNVGRKRILASLFCFTFATALALAYGPFGSNRTSDANKTQRAATAAKAEAASWFKASMERGQVWKIYFLA
jgi:hypothetical protein